MKQIILVITLCVFIYNLLYAQDFGCFSIPEDDYGRDDIYSRSRLESLIKEFDYTAFKIKNCIDGYYKEHYDNDVHNPQQLKMEGNIVNGERNGKWFLYIKDYLCFITGNYINGKKEGSWNGYCIYYGSDTICVLKENYKNDLLDGKRTEYYQNGKISKISYYVNGLKDGEEVKYYECDTSDTVHIYEKSYYKSGLLIGEHIEYYKSNAIACYEIYTNGKKNGTCNYFNGKRIIDYKNDKLDGKYLLYHENGILAYEIEFRDNFPYTVSQANDSNGNKLDPGTLKNGNGTLMSYFENGQVRSKFEYKHQMISGNFSCYRKSGNVVEEGQLYCNQKKVYTRTQPTHIIEDFNLFTAWNQNFTTGTNYQIYSKDKKVKTKIISISCDSLEEDAILIQNFSENRTISHEYTNMYGLKIGEEKKYFDNGQIKMTGNYIMSDQDSIKRSIKSGIFRYYFENDTLRAEIAYKNDIEYGKSYYYDDSGKLRRIKEIKNDGEIINIFDNDTVNYTDSNGLKQGKWIDFPFFWPEEHCTSQPNSIKYYKNDNPAGVWEIYNSDGTILSEKYIWEDSVVAKYFDYNRRNGMLIEEGYMQDEYTKTGVWKEYDYKKGYLKFQGEYINGRKEGIWRKFRKNGKIKKEILFKNGIINTR